MLRIPGTDAPLSSAGQKIQYEQAAHVVKTHQERRQQQTEAGAGAQWQPHGQDDADAKKVTHEDHLLATRRRDWASDPLLARYIELLEKMFGVKVAILDPNDLAANGTGEVLAAQEEGLIPAPSRPRLSIMVDYSAPEVDVPQVDFRAAGSMTAEDGRTIKVQLQSTVSRAYLEHAERAPEDGEVKHNVALDLGRLPAQVAGADVDFKLNDEGQLDRFQLLGDRSTYVAWERGAEGSRASEKAADIYEHLALWHPRAVDSSGSNSLNAAQIGAIYDGPEGPQQQIDFAA